jgi:YVTN family beta-propeller protein
MKTIRTGGAHALLPAALTLCITLVLAFAAMPSTADVRVSQSPATQGRPLTPAGFFVMDITTRQVAVGALPVDFVRSPDRDGPDGQGRYLIVVNSGFGLQFNGAANRAEQSLAVIDLNFKPRPAVIQNVYFPSPQSVNVGLVFSPQPESDGTYQLYASGGFENKIWMLRFHPSASPPITPVARVHGGPVEAPFIDVSAFSTAAPSPNYNDNHAPVYPSGLAISPDGDTLYVANNLGDSLGIISDLRGTRRISRTDLHAANLQQLIYPYTVIALPARDGRQTAKVYVSCWNSASVAVIDPRKPERPAAFIAVERHPTAMILNRAASRLYVANSDADSVSVIDTESDREIERISVRLGDGSRIGSSPEGLSLSGDGATLYVANAHSNAIAVVALSERARGQAQQHDGDGDDNMRSRLRGFIPTGQYPSAVFVAGNLIFVGNGKGTGFDNSSLVANHTGLAPNVANDRFPAGTGRGGQYILSLISGNLLMLAEPDDRTLAEFTAQVMRNNGLIGERKATLFAGPSPIRHVIYIIKENRTYDQVFGDLTAAGDGTAADGDAALAIFGTGEAASRPSGPQRITPNHQALALRFGLFDRFFVNSEASPDGHNWSTAAFSSDYVDKAYRWDYSGRGRTYDYEGFNRLPDYEPPSALPQAFRLPVAAADVAGYMQRFIPYLNGSRDVAEPETLYLWDAAARAGLSYRNYGEFIGTISEGDVAALNARRPKKYPDVSPTVSTLPTKKSLEGHHSQTFRAFDLYTPDAMTTESYREAKQSGGQADPLMARDSADARFRGTSRLGEWLSEFRGYTADREAGLPDRMPNLTVLRLPNDHTNGLKAGMPTPQFYVAENDYAIGRLVEAVSNSLYWKDTAIFITEDDAQDGPDHVDAHRSVALVISAYNRLGALIHQFHNTVSLIRTIEILLGIEPMNQLDAAAAPIDIFQSSPDLRPYRAVLPEVALDNLLTTPATSPIAAYWMKRSAELNLRHADVADPYVLNQVIWFSTRGASARMPAIAHLPAFDVIREGVAYTNEVEKERSLRAGRSKPAAFNKK